MDTAEWLRRHGAGRALLASVILSGAVAGCGGEARTYLIGEGAPLPAGYEQAYTEGGGMEGIGRPTSPVETWGVGCGQSFSGGRSRTAALLQHPCGENQQVFAVTDDFWDLFRKAGNRAAIAYGFPVGRRGEWAGGWTQGFGHGGGLSAFFMQRPGRPPQVVSGPMLEYYLSFDDRHERFGYPTAPQRTVPGGRRCQQFEQAVITVTKHDDRYSFSESPIRGDSPPPECAG